MMLIVLPPPFLCYQSGALSLTRTSPHPTSTHSPSETSHVQHESGASRFQQPVVDVGSHWLRSGRDPFLFVKNLIGRVERDEQAAPKAATIGGRGRRQGEGGAAAQQ